MVAVGEAAAGFFQLTKDGGGAVALHETLVADGRQIKGDFSIGSETLDESGHGIADVDAFHTGREHETAGVTVVHQEVNVVFSDFVGGKLYALANVKFAGVRVQKALDLFGCHDTITLVVHKDENDATVAALKFSQLLLEGEEQILVQTPVQEGAEAVHILDVQNGELAYLSIRFFESGDGAVFAIGVDENVQNFPFFQGEFFTIAGEKDAVAAFQFQIVALRCNFFHAGAVVSSKIHNEPFRSVECLMVVRPYELGINIAYLRLSSKYKMEPCVNGTPFFKSNLYRKILILEAFNHQEASDADDEPQDDALDKGLGATLLEGCLGKTCTDEEQGNGKTALCDGDDCGSNSVRNAEYREQVWVDDHGDGKEENEPGNHIELALAAILAEEYHGDEGQGQNPECAGAFDHGGHLQGFVTVGCCGAHHGTGVVDSDGCPFAELLVIKAKEVTQGRENQKCQGVQYKDCSQGNAHLLVVGVHNGSDCCDGGTTTNGGTAGN